MVTQALVVMLETAIKSALEVEAIRYGGHGAQCGHHAMEVMVVAILLEATATMTCSCNKFSYAKNFINNEFNHFVLKKKSCHALSHLGHNVGGSEVSKMMQYICNWLKEQQSSQALRMYIYSRRNSICDKVVIL